MGWKHEFPLKAPNVIQIQRINIQLSPTQTLKEYVVYTALRFCLFVFSLSCCSVFLEQHSIFCVVSIILICSNNNT